MSRCYKVYPYLYKQSNYTKFVSEIFEHRLTIKKEYDDLIKALYKDNLSLHKELSKQSKVVDEAEKYQKEREEILADNERLHNTVKSLKHKYKVESNNLNFDFNNRKKNGLLIYTKGSYYLRALLLLK